MTDEHDKLLTETERLLDEAHPSCANPAEELAFCSHLENREMHIKRLQSALDRLRAELAEFYKGEWVASEDVNRMARELDVAMNGEKGAAKNPSLCDVVAQAKKELAERDAQEPHRWEYYYRQSECTADIARSAACVCWFPEDTGPFPDEKHDDPSTTMEWRDVYLAPPSPRPAVPDGWQMVPVEPTAEMLHAAAERRYGWEHGGSAGSYDAIAYYNQSVRPCSDYLEHAFRYEWNAALSAAPRQGEADATLAEQIGAELDECGDWRLPFYAVKSGGEAVSEMLPINEWLERRRESARKLADASGDEWQPIETAPTDGQAVLIWCPKEYKGNGGQHVAAYMDWGDQPGWYSNVISKHEPSHWMWPPEPPATQAEKGGDGDA
ncbi:hypothetical protein [Algiphilus sp.]|uniref:hypothetical protein n=1 Tax=Algiphilus sp. TaxID=1872431 RepID=UPI003CCC2857